MPQRRLLSRACSPLLLLLRLVPLLLLLPCPARSLGLYTPDDPLALLRADTLERSVFYSGSAWVVEFYASWCGHCIHFAPTWRALAADIKDWRPAVMLGVVDCAETSNQNICSKFGIVGYPTLKFFKAFSKEPDDGIRLYHHGDDIRTLRESIITSLERHEQVWPSACPPLEPISVAELHSFFQTNNMTYLALIFEKEDSFLGKEVTLDMLQFENIVVRRVLKSNGELVSRYGITAFPSGVLLFNNGSCSNIPVHTDSRPLYTDFLRKLPNVIRGTSFNLTVLPSALPKTTPGPWKVADRGKVYMADLESAVRYSLQVEAGRFLILDAEHLSVMKQYVALLVKYFPGRPVVMNYLRNLDSRLRQITNISQSEWMEAIKNNKELSNARLPETPNWVGCQGSKPEFRGYPCSVWTLFHVLTVQEALRNLKDTSQSEVLAVMRAYVRYFFGCRECADHFEGMAAGSMDQVRNGNEASRWLWASHNKVNARLAGTASEDPKYPKIQWPSQDLCWSCQITVNRRPVWNETAVMSFLKHHFSRDNIYLDFIKLEKRHLGRQGRDVEKVEHEAEEQLEEGGGGEDGRTAEEGTAQEKKESGRVEHKRPGYLELHRPTIVKMATKAKDLEEEIVDLDSFSEHHYKSKALKAAAQASNNHRRRKRDTGLVPLIDSDAAWQHLKHKSLVDQQLIGIMEEEEEGGVTLRRRSHWFSRLDVSLCIVLYFLSSTCLLGMYMFFRMRMRYRKGRPGFPLA